MKETDPAAVPDFRRIAPLFEQVGDFLLKRCARTARPNLRECELLRLEHGVPELALGVTGLPFDNGPGQITVVMRLGMPWENVQNDQRICLERAAAAIIGIPSLIPSRYNRVPRHPAGLQNRRLDFSAQPL